MNLMFSFSKKILLLRLGPYSSLRQDSRLLLLVEVHLLQVGYIPELHPDMICDKKKVTFNVSKC